MGYELHAVIADEALLRAASPDIPGARVARLRQGLSLLPITDELFDSVTDGGSEGVPGFWRLPPGLEKLLAQWSAAGPVAYVEAEYFGGVGEQRAAVWAGGALVWGPTRAGRAQEGGGRRVGLYAGFCTGGPRGPSGDGHPSRAGVATGLVRSTRGLGRAALERPRRALFRALLLTLLRVGFT